MPTAEVDNRRMATVDAALCPCGNGETYGSCCGRFHRGAATAPTAEALMRSRFSAFAVGDAAYLLRTWHSSVRPAQLDLDPRVRWTRLEILGSTGGGLLEPTGTVEFRAYHGDGALHENSRFVRENKQWVYLGPAL
jgi:SEC-C motif-containing protein